MVGFRPLSLFPSPSKTRDPCKAWMDWVIDLNICVVSREFLGTGFLDLETKKEAPRPSISFRQRRRR